VNSDVTLTIEAGVTVNLNDHYIQVEGVLQARGNEADPIHFNSGTLKFTESSDDWNEQTGTGCIVENAVLSSAGISSKSAIKINHNTINGDVTVNGPSVVSSNTIVGSVATVGSTTVLQNTVTGRINGGGDTTSENYLTISGNIITQGAGYINCAIESTGYALIADNTISDCNYGINIITGRDRFGGSIAPNTIVERNTITGTTHGIHIEIYSAMVYGSIKPSISDNAVSKNTVGLYLDGDAHYLTLKNNNLGENYDYNIYLSSPQNLDATDNWWGTTDTQSIKQKIFDFNRDFNLGNVIFVPFLTAPNPEITPSPTASPSATPTPSQEPPPIEFTVIIGTIIIVATISVGLSLLIYLIKRK
jgi:parallel beta-helix repeat protein